MGPPIYTQERPTSTRPRPPSESGPPVARLPVRPAPRHPVGRPANDRRTQPQTAALRLPRLGWSAPVRQAARHTGPGRLATPERPAPAAQGRPPGSAARQPSPQPSNGCSSRHERISAKSARSSEDKPMDVIPTTSDFGLDFPANPPSCVPQGKRTFWHARLSQSHWGVP